MVKKRLDDLFHDGLKSLYFAEIQLFENLARLADAAQSAALRSAFLTHREETATQVERLDAIFHLLGRAPRARLSEGIRGLIMEDEALVRDYDGSEALDAALIADGQAIARYQIARYGALKSWAIQLGWTEVATLLDQTIREKKNADASMCGLAASEMAPKAA